MSRTVEIEFGWADKPGPNALCHAVLDRYALRRPGEIVQALEITGIAPEHVEWVQVSASIPMGGFGIVFETAGHMGGQYMAWMAKNMGLGSFMRMQFHSPGRAIAPGAGIEWHHYLMVAAQLTSRATVDAPMRLEITLEKAARTPVPLKCNY